MACAQRGPFQPEPSLHGFERLPRAFAGTRPAGLLDCLSLEHVHP